MTKKDVRNDKNGMKYKEFIVLDVETTGVDAKRDDIIELSAVKLNDKAEVVDELDILLSTDQALSPIVIALTGIRPQDIAGQPNIAEVKDRIKEFIGDAPIVGHNIGFDMEFLNAKGFELANPALDTLELAYTILPAQSYYSLEYLAYHFNFDNQPKHRAMADVLATVDLFKLLVSHIAGFKPSTLTQINELIQVDAWSWDWLFREPSNFPGINFKTRDDKQIAVKKIVQEVGAAAGYLQQLKSLPHKINFIESHHDVHPISLSLAYAVKVKPALVVVPVKDFWQIDWQQVGKDLNINLALVYDSNTGYSVDAEVRLAKVDKPLSSIEARLVVKVVVWRREWDEDRDKLFLSRDEKYQWEQKIAPMQSTAPSPLPTADVLIATASTWLATDDIGNLAVVTAHPMMLEDAAWFEQTKLFSVNYFSAAISSRRDFVHQYIRPHDVKLADELFKLLHHISIQLTDLSSRLIKLYIEHPPASVYDRNIELDDGLVDSEFKSLVGQIADGLQEYLTKLQSTQREGIDRQVEQTQKLLHYLRALQTLVSDFRYFLYADANRFFLELVPTTPSFTALSGMVSQARSFTAIAPGLTVAGKFDYFTSVFGSVNGMIIAPPTKTELLLINEPSNQHGLLMQRITSQLLERQEKTLVLAASAYEAKEIFSQVFASVQELATGLESHDTVGNVICLPNRMKKPLVLVGNYNWFKRMEWVNAEFDRIVLSKMPFDPISRPQFKVLGGGENGFEEYVLPRAVMRLKETLHLVKLLKKPLVLVDGRLTEREYGPKVVNSLNAFTVIPTKADEALE